MRTPKWARDLAMRVRAAAPCVPVHSWCAGAGTDGRFRVLWCGGLAFAYADGTTAGFKRFVLVEMTRKRTWDAVHVDEFVEALRGVRWTV